VRKVLFLAGFLFLTVSVIAPQARALLGPDDVPRMSIDELKAQLNNPDYIIIDVRKPEHWEKSDAKIKGAIREDPRTVDSWLTKYPKDKTLVFYCN